MNDYEFMYALMNGGEDYIIQVLGGDIVAEIPRDEGISGIVGKCIKDYKKSLSIDEINASVDDALWEVAKNIHNIESKIHLYSYFKTVLRNDLYNKVEEKYAQCRTPKMIDPLTSKHLEIEDYKATKDYTDTEFKISVNQISHNLTANEYNYVKLILDEGLMTDKQASARLNIHVNTLYNTKKSLKQKFRSLFS